MARRGNNEGSIYKRADGWWAAALTIPDGKRRTLYGKTRQDVAKKLTVALRDREAGLPVLPERQTIEQFLTRWLETAAPTVRHTTYVRYEQYIRLHTVPIIGSIRLPRLTPQHLQDLYAKKLAEGLSPTSVRHLHTVLHRELKQALRWNLVEESYLKQRTHLAVQPRKIRRSLRRM